MLEDILIILANRQVADSMLLHALTTDIVFFHHDLILPKNACALFRSKIALFVHSIITLSPKVLSP
jgi:hypothetical protein